MMKKFRQFLLIVVLVLAGLGTAHLVTGCKAERPNTKPGPAPERYRVNSIGMKLAYISACLARTHKGSYFGDSLVRESISFVLTYTNVIVEITEFVFVFELT